MQDMPIGVHGIFPVLHEHRIFVTAGGAEAGYSQSTLHYQFTPCSARAELSERSDAEGSEHPDAIADSLEAPPSPAQHAASGSEVSACQGLRYSSSALQSSGIFWAGTVAAVLTFMLWL